MVRVLLDLRKAFPIMEPNDFAGSVAFIASPSVGELVSKSPGSIGQRVEWSLQYTFPMRATGTPSTPSVGQG
jgi:hypothetical protein